jgi:glycerol-3-phosphate acyltransferase PlsY
VLGHDFSVFRGFRGGKGVATSIGVILLYTPLSGLVTGVVWLAAVLVTRVSALGALSGFAGFPVAVWLMGYGWEKLLVSVIISVLLFIRHTSNIREMLKKGRDNASGEA